MILIAYKILNFILFKNFIDAGMKAIMLADLAKSLHLKKKKDWPHHFLMQLLLNLLKKKMAIEGRI